MKNILPLFALVTLLGCAGNMQQPASESEIPLVKCEHSAAFGDVDVCLPEIEGMKECFANPNVKKIAKTLDFEGNSVIAYYLNDSTHKQIDKLDELIFDDYFMVYGANVLKGLKADKEELNNMADLIKKGLIQEKWDEIKAKTEKNIDFVSIGQPIIIDDYIPYTNSKSIVMLIKYEVPGFEYVMVANLSILLIHNRLISVAYYKDYNGDESVKQAKAKNTLIVKRVMEVN